MVDRQNESTQQSSQVSPDVIAELKRRFPHSDIPDTLTEEELKDFTKMHEETEAELPRTA